MTITRSVRYLVVNTGGWLLGRRVLIAPVAVSDFDEAEQILRVNLTRPQVEGSPPLDTAKPISRQYEEEYYRRYQWSPYWGVGMAGETHVPPPPRVIAKSVEGDKLPAREIEQSHLRSSAEQ